MILTAEAQVFSDALMDLGFEFTHSDQNGHYFVGSFTKLPPRLSQSISVDLMNTLVRIWWWNGRPGGAGPWYVYKFPMQWLAAIATIKELIKLDEHFGRTGERSPAPRSSRE